MLTTTDERAGTRLAALLSLAVAACAGSSPPPSTPSVDQPSTRTAPPSRAPEVDSEGSQLTLEPARAGIKGTTAVFPYAAFGPQSMSYELLGDEVYNWPDGGSEDPNFRYDIRVVVFVGPRAPIQAAYPTIEKRSDYRLIERDRALAHLDRNIVELADESEGPMAELRESLTDTRRRLLEELPPAADPATHWVARDWMTALRGRKAARLAELSTPTIAIGRVAIEGGTLAAACRALADRRLTNRDAARRLVDCFAGRLAAVEHLEARPDPTAPTGLQRSVWRTADPRDCGNDALTLDVVRDGAEWRVAAVAVDLIDCDDP
jgi:hypothetical protein